MDGAVSNKQSMNGPASGASTHDASRQHAVQKRSSYFGNIAEATRTLLHGLKLTWRHFFQASQSRKPIGVENDSYFEQQTGIVTLQYPRESLPVPDNGRYRLHNEIEDCIVCDKCAKICPVDCIEIEPIKATETFGQTSDGTPKRIYAARFDIDMAKCCFCGLCTTVCPTECLTMTKVYDFSEFDVADHTYAFGEMSPLEILQKRKEQEAFHAQKVAKAAASGSAAAKPAVARPGVARPGMARPAQARPGIPKPAPAAGQAPSDDVQETARKLMEQKQAEQTPNPVAKSAPTPEGTENTPAPGANKPVFRPRIPLKPKTAAADKENDASASSTEPKENQAPAATASAGPKPRPVMKPLVKKASAPTQETPAADQPSIEAQAASAPSTPRPRPVMKPVVKKNVPTPEQSESTSKPEPDPEASQPADRPRPVVKPIIRKAADAEASPEAASQQPASAPAAAQSDEKPARPRPVIKPKVPKQSMQAEETPEEREAKEQDIKQPRPVVKPKVVVRKPAQEDKSEEDKRQEDGLRPKPPGSSR